MLLKNSKEVYQKYKEYYRRYYLKNKEKFLAHSRNQAQKRLKTKRKEMKINDGYQGSPYSFKPKVEKCFRCKEWFLVKYVPWKKRFSLKNNWSFWTGNEEEDRKICDVCLKDLYFNHKKDYKRDISNFDRRMTLRSYVRFIN
ncbi:MAG: hypothetical protein I3273_05125 [Candidatus Moeniiplasma glomeromycotorum]|nr:hypothetical protein [Candidatus Moeniiplasma glomeromycotorum]MCE8169475.1 hypothetical protein [Candidatus Moeniiplasma glomeromycotorum]